MDSSDSSKPRLHELTLMRINISEVQPKQTRKKIVIHNYELDTLKIVADADVDVDIDIRDSVIKHIDIGGKVRLKLKSLEIHDSVIEDGLEYLFKLDTERIILDNINIDDISIKNTVNTVYMRLKDCHIQRFELMKASIKLYDINNVHIENLRITESTLKTTKQSIENLVKYNERRVIDNVEIKPLYIGNIKNGFIAYKIGKLAYVIKTNLHKERLKREYLDIFDNTSEKNNNTLVLK